MRRTSRARVLVVEDVEMEAKLLMRALADAGYSNLAHSPDAVRAIAEIEANPPRLIISDFDLERARRVAAKTPFRTLDKTAGVYVLMLTSSRHDDVLSRCFESSEDDYFDDEEPISAFRTSESIIDLAKNLGEQTRVWESAESAPASSRPLIEAAPASRESPLEALSRTPTWRDAEAVLTKALTDFFQLPFAPVPVVDDKGDAFVAEVLLAAPLRELEISLSVVVETASMKRLGAHLLGDEDLEGAEALVLEVANIMMGTMKTAFSAHDFAFTGTLPTREKLAASRLMLNRSRVRKRFAISADGSEIELWLRANDKRNKIVFGYALREGLIVSEDVYNSDGALLIKAGSRLTQTTAERLSGLVPDLSISVCEPNG